MQIALQFSSVWLAFIFLLMGILLGVQLLLIFRNKTLSKHRKALRLFLNLFFFFCLVLLLLQPVFYRDYSPKKLLVHDPAISQPIIRKLKDSLAVDNSISIEHYKAKPDEVYLLGQDFTPSQLGKLMEANLNWIPFYDSTQLLTISWEGLVREGENQTIKGKIHADEESRLTLHYGNEILDSLWVTSESNTFQFTSPPKAIGRNELSLQLNENELGKIKFFCVENQPLHYLMRFNYPDMEIRRLSEWLGRKGEEVSSRIQTSKSILQRSSTFGNQDTAQFYITESSFANSPEIKEALQSGASLLFTNFSDPDKELLQINRALGTNWSVNRTTSEANRGIEGELTALPYKLIPQANQWELLDGAVGYQKVGQNKIGISLLEATFPIALQGDSAAYAGVWDRILSAMRPAEGIYYQIPHPIFEGIISEEWQINSPMEIEPFLNVEGDSVFLSPSPINPNTYSGKWQAGSSGWKTLSDSLEVSVYDGKDDFPYVRQNRQMSRFLQYYHDQPPPTGPYMHKFEPSAWWWFGLVVLSATFLWIEPKVNIFKF